MAREIEVIKAQLRRNLVTMCFFGGAPLVSRLERNRGLGRAFEKAVSRKLLARRTRALCKLNGVREGVEVGGSRHGSGERGPRAGGARVAGRRQEVAGLDSEYKRPPNDSNLALRQSPATYLTLCCASGATRRTKPHSRMVYSRCRAVGDDSRKSLGVGRGAISWMTLT
jgi:hypothetical protein